MPEVIWKHQLTEPKTVLNLQWNAEVIHVAMDPKGNLPCIWERHEIVEEAVMLPRTYHAFPTGATMNLKASHVGTIVLDNGLVWHIYEERHQSLTEGFDSIKRAIEDTRGGPAPVQVQGYA